MPKRKEVKPAPANSFEAWCEGTPYSDDLKTMCQQAYVAGMTEAEQIARSTVWKSPVKRSRKPKTERPVTVITEKELTDACDEALQSH